MNTQQLKPPIKRRRLMALLFMMTLTFITVACAKRDEGLAVPGSTPSTAPTQTAFSTHTPTRAVHNEKQAFMTHVAATQDAYRTIVATRGTSTPNVGPPPTYATYTPVMGILPGEPNRSKNPASPIKYSGWRGWLNGEIVEVNAGTEGESGDTGQGLIQVFVWGQPIQTYRTPLRAGPVLVTSVNGTSLTLTTEDGQHIFGFDLSTRQWVSGTPLPTPSISTSPLPTLSPSLSPIPSVPPLP